MRDDPGLNAEAIAACLAGRYGVHAATIDYLPLGYDLDAAVYRVVASDGASWFLKIRPGPIAESPLLVPRVLNDLGIVDALAPRPTSDGDLWTPLDGATSRAAILYPFIDGRDAVAAGLTDAQWRAFGATLRAIHDSGAHVRFRGLLPVETFALPSAAPVRQALTAAGPIVASDAAGTFAAFWRENADRIEQMLARAETLGATLRAKAFDHVLCHADIHAANILVGDDGRIHLIDWDGPKIAPRERDLLFVLGSRIARTVEPWEEARFFEGYGSVAVDPEALVYYRYERVIEDIADLAPRILFDPRLGEAARRDAAELTIGFFAPGGDLDRAEVVSLPPGVQSVG